MLQHVARGQCHDGLCAQIEFEQDKDEINSYGTGDHGCAAGAQRKAGWVAALIRTPGLPAANEWLCLLDQCQVLQVVENCAETFICLSLYHMLHLTCRSPTHLELVDMYHIHCSAEPKSAKPRLPIWSGTQRHSNRSHALPFIIADSLQEPVA